MLFSLRAKEKVSLCVCELRKQTGITSVVCSSQFPFSVVRVGLVLFVRSSFVDGIKLGSIFLLLMVIRIQLAFVFHAVLVVSTPNRQEEDHGESCYAGKRQCQEELNAVGSFFTLAFIPLLQSCVSQWSSGIMVKVL